jgi:hypothetical protein
MINKSTDKDLGKKLISIYTNYNVDCIRVGYRTGGFYAKATTRVNLESKVIGSHLTTSPADALDALIVRLAKYKIEPIPF